MSLFQIDHPYSKMPQFTDLRVHSVPIGSLSTPEEVNKRNKRKASSSTEQTPKKSSKGSSSSVPAATPASEAKSEKKKEKKEKKEKKDKNYFPWIVYFKNVYITVCVKLFVWNTTIIYNVGLFLDIIILTFRPAWSILIGPTSRLHS